MSKRPVIPRRPRFCARTNSFRSAGRLRAVQPGEFDDAAERAKSDELGAVILAIDHEHAIVDEGRALRFLPLDREQTGEKFLAGFGVGGRLRELLLTWVGSERSRAKG